MCIVYFEDMEYLSSKIIHIGISQDNNGINQNNGSRQINNNILLDNKILLHPIKTLEQCRETIGRRKCKSILLTARNRLRQQ